MNQPNASPPLPPSAATHPYGARVKLLFGSDVELHIPGGNAQAALADGTVATIHVEPRSSREEAANLTRATFSFEGYSSATDAEEAGNRAAVALLWSAVSKRFSMRVEHTAIVYLRNSGGGLSVRAEGRAFWPLTAADLFGLVTEGLATPTAPRPELVTSLEFFVSAGLESTPSARFVMLMTSLESLAIQLENGAQVEALIEKLVEHTAGDAALDVPIRNSLIGRIRDLRRESVRQAIIRTVRTELADDAAVKFVDRAYASRSAILHTGARVPDLDLLITGLGEIMRRIFVSILGLELRTPIFPSLNSRVDG